MDMQEQMNFIHEIFSASLPRLGAGDDASTKKALARELGTDYENVKMIGSLRLRLLF